MVYVFDTSSLIVLGHYFPQRFPSFWTHFEKSVQRGEILSAREVYNELKGKGNKPHLDDWLDSNKKVFLVPTPDEAAFVGTILAVPHFQQLVSKQQRLKGVPVVDPFVIAIAKVRDGCVVTGEAKKPGAARIPNVCEHFRIACCNLETFMETKGCNSELRSRSRPNKAMQGTPTSGRPKDDRGPQHHRKLPEHSRSASQTSK